VACCLGTLKEGGADLEMELTLILLRVVSPPYFSLQFVCPACVSFPSLPFPHWALRRACPTSDSADTKRNSENGTRQTIGRKHKGCLCLLVRHRRSPPPFPSSSFPS
jgi:hypothetical protein